MDMARRFCRISSTRCASRLTTIDLRAAFTLMRSTSAQRCTNEPLLVTYLPYRKPAMNFRTTSEALERLSEIDDGSRESSGHGEMITNARIELPERARPRRRSEQP